MKQADSVRCAVLFLALAQFLAASDAPAKLVGRWRSLETSKGGIGGMLEFHQDGTVDFSQGAVVAGNYRIEGNQLILPPETQDGAEQNLNFEFVSDNVMHIKAAASNATGQGTQELVRKGARANAKNPIVGEWIENRDMGGQHVQAHWIFDASGKLLLLIPLLTKHGHFSANADTIRIDLPNREPIEGNFKIDGDVLELPRKGNVSRYTRY